MENVSISTDPFWTRAVLIMLPAALTPVFAWLSSLRTAARRSAELDALLRRLELVERVQKLYGVGERQGAYREVLDAELRDILADLSRLRGPEAPAHVLASRTENLPRWRSWFLAYKQASVKGALYKALFYVSLAFAVLGGIGLMTSASDRASGLGATDTVILGFLGGGFYVAIGLAFRAAALRDYRKRLGKGSAQIPATAVGAQAGGV